MTTHPFDTLSETDLRELDCGKWSEYGADVLPLWVADMDFPAAGPIRRAVADHALHASLMYPPQQGVAGLREALVERLATRHGWSPSPDAVHPISGIVPGLFVGVASVTSPGDEVIVQPPVYPPFMMAVEDAGRALVHNPLRRDRGGWRVDLDDLERRVTPATRALVLCNPHNPVGRVFTRAELEGIAEVALRHRLWVIADELHADLVLDGEHVPFASLSPEVAERTLTLVGPTKAFNIAGLKVGFVVAENEALLARVRAIAQGPSPQPNVLGQVAALAAYRDGDAWLADTLAYLRGNRDALAEALAADLPEVGFVPPEGTYLAWLDVSAYGLDDPQAFFLERARVALSGGAAFGPGGEGFVRLNFATPRSVLREAVARMRGALEDRARGTHPS